ncbi:MAG: Ig-like domain-containing protein, partial [Balneolaceae bacterium]
DYTATFTPASDLEFNSTYAVTVTTGVQDLAGNNMSSNVNWNFTTEQETIPPEVISQNPADGATDVPVDISSIEVTFSEPMDPSTIDATTFQVTLNGSAVSGSINYADNTATFTPASNLEFNSTYAVTVTTGVEDLVGNNMAENVAWTFTTEQEQTPPQVLSTSPANNTADVPINSTIRVTFSEEMNSSTITTTTILVSQNGTPVPGSINYLDKIATFTPSSNLAYGSDYSATVTTGVEDLAGNHLIADFNWTFVTELSSSTIPLTGN